MRYLSLLQCTKASITWYSLSAWMSDIVVIKTKENVRWIKWILRWRWNNIFYKQAYLNSSRIHTVLNTCIMDMRITFGSYGGLLVSRFRTIWYLRIMNYYRFCHNSLANYEVMKYATLDSTNQIATWKYKVSSHQTREGMKMINKFWHFFAYEGHVYKISVFNNKYFRSSLVDYVWFVASCSIIYYYDVARHSLWLTSVRDYRWKIQTNNVFPAMVNCLW